MDTLTSPHDLKYSVDMPGIPPDDPAFAAYWRSLVEKQVCLTLTEELQREGLPVPDPVPLEARFREDLRVTGPFVDFLEEDFDWPTPDTDFRKLRTVRDLIDYYEHPL